MQDAPRTYKLNDNALSLQLKMKRKKDYLVKKKGTENSTFMFLNV